MVQKPGHTFSGWQVGWDDPIMTASLWPGLRPMLATAGEDLPTGADWLFEVKWDGVRAMARIDADCVSLRSRTGGDLFDRYPGLARAGLSLGQEEELILDGECVAFDSAGQPSFPSAMRSGAAVTFVAFDVLAIAGRDLRDEPLLTRRAALAALELDQRTAGAWRAPGHFTDGEALFTATADSGLEGVMAKRAKSRYRSGVRSPDWLKFPHRTLTDVVVVGYIKAESGSGASSLLIADAEGQFLGTVGSGLTNATSIGLAAALDAVALPGPAPMLRFEWVAPAMLAKRFPGRVRWARPAIVASVRHLGRTEGLVLRQPTLERVRTDLTPSDVAPIWSTVPRPEGPPRQGAGPGPQLGTDWRETAPLAARVGGHTVRLTHLDKVLYPADGTTKAQLISYFMGVAEPLLHQLAGRPITRHRWPHGIAGADFFEKAVPRGAPSWLGRVGLRRTVGSRSGEYAGYIDYPLLAGTADEVAALVWFAQTGVLELHTPQWRVRRKAQFGVPGPVDRMVLALDPGPPAGLRECCEVAVIAREILTGAGFAATPVASGSKGLHVYVPFPVPLPPEQVLELADVVADGLAAAAGDLVIRRVNKAARAGRVYVDVAQNAAARTTITPYSPRGRELPTVATPLLWSEVAEATAHPATVHTMPARLAALGDLMVASGPG
jgi:bifunctional non-homologous end joining protein LigD